MSKKKIMSTLAVLTFGAIIATSSVHPIKSHGFGTSGNGTASQSITIPHYDDGNGNQTRDPNKGDDPTYFVFDKSVDTLHTDYPDGMKFWDTFYNNKFHWYSFVPPDEAMATDQDKDMSRMVENRQRYQGGTGWKLVDPTYSWNLKLGQQTPNTQSMDMYLGDNTGTTLITGDSYTGNHYEWRYLGYSAEGGIPIDNPYFAPDYPSQTVNDWKPETYNWISNPWNQGLVTESPYDRMIDPQVNQNKIFWFEQYFFPENPEFRRLDMDLYSDAADWANKFTLQMNPDHSTGIITGWHQENGHTYYASFILKTPPRPNLRVVDFLLKDKETGQIMGEQTINANDNNDITQVRTYPNQTLTRGKTYVVSATVKNMVVDGLSPHDTTYQPVRMESYFSFDDDSHLNNVWDVGPTPNILPDIDAVTKIPYGQSASFNRMDNGNGAVSWDYTVPLANQTGSFQKEVVIGASIVQGFFNAGDNTYTNDDYGRLRFYVQNDDIGVRDTAQLTDSAGNTVQSVIPNQTYGLKVTVFKALGDNTVGIAGDNNNPYATVDVTFSDSAGNTKTITGIATDSITSTQREVVVTIPNAFTPRTGDITASWQLDKIARDKGQSTDPSNDGPYSYTWKNDINISVQNFTVNPSTVILPQGQYSSNETLTFDFQVNNANAENQPKSMPIVIRRNGYEIERRTVEVPANNLFPQSWTIPNVYVSQGDNVFTVEANPAPRTWIEQVSGVADPYADNVANYSVTVYQNPGASYCNLVNNENDWTRIYDQTLVYGYRQYWTSCGDYGCWTYSWCVTTYYNSWTSYVNQYESYKITHVYFRSKLTDDTQGGWVDILYQPGKVKAGYGFDMKVDVEYNTNTYDTSPKSWYSDCSYYAVYPSYSYVSAPTQMTMTMPYTDRSGNPVQYQLNSPSQSGSWDHLSQEYLMPMHDAFGMENTREVFINEIASDGDYQVRLDTYPWFFGTYDKTYSTTSYNTWPMLCDMKNVVIRVLGSDSDDVKSHVIP